jgi:hypothetical protein
MAARPCIGNSGPLIPEVSAAVSEHDLTVCSVLSGNRNFEGRIHPECQIGSRLTMPSCAAIIGRHSISTPVIRRPQHGRRQAAAQRLHFRQLRHAASRRRASTATRLPLQRPGSVARRPAGTAPWRVLGSAVVPADLDGVADHGAGGAVGQALRRSLLQRRLEATV